VPDRGIFDRYRLFIFDADDTLRRTVVPGRPCPWRAEDWELLPGVQQLLSRPPWNQPGGPLIGIASNQDHVGYGHLSLDTARDLLRDLARQATGIELPDAALQLCPHRLEVVCRCRKPEPGMLAALMDHYRVEAGETLFVGNHETDREAARRAGTAFAWAADFFEPSASVTAWRSQQV
jgi:D-glycero-D-manno-heptose 1,7-bisphosphate phosphatase